MLVFSYIAVVKLSMRTIIFSSNIHLFFFQWAPFSVKMGTGNYTTVTEFIILGLAEDSTVCVILFIVFLGVYLVTLIGNISIIILIRSSPQLHTPMYLFLCHLAFSQLIRTSTRKLRLKKERLLKFKIMKFAPCQQHIQQQHLETPEKLTKMGSTKIFNIYNGDVS